MLPYPYGIAPGASDAIGMETHLHEGVILVMYKHHADLVAIAATIREETDISSADCQALIHITKTMDIRVSRKQPGDIFLSKHCNNAVELRWNCLPDYQLAQKGKTCKDNGSA